MTLAENQLHPLKIEDAREAAFKASELQKAVETDLRNAAKALAEAERSYRKKLTERILSLKADGMAITACADVARGEKAVADLRYNRDVAEGILEAAKQQAFRRGADRKDVHQLLRWSQGRDLASDAEPADWSKQETHGRGLRSAA